MAPDVMKSPYAPKKWIHLLQPETQGMGPNVSIVHQRNVLNEAFYKQFMLDYPGSFYLVGFDRMAAGSPWQSGDGMHFQCGMSRERDNISESTIKALIKVADGGDPNLNHIHDRPFLMSMFSKASSLMASPALRGAAMMASRSGSAANACRNAAVSALLMKVAGGTSTPSLSSPKMMSSNIPSPSFACSGLNYGAAATGAGAVPAVEGARGTEVAAGEADGDESGVSSTSSEPTPLCNSRRAKRRKKGL
eukprot:gene24823-10473_t